MKASQQQALLGVFLAFILGLGISALGYHNKKQIYL